MSMATARIQSIRNLLQAQESFFCVWSDDRWNRFLVSVAVAVEMERARFRIRLLRQTARLPNYDSHNFSGELMVS